MKKLFYFTFIALLFCGCSADDEVVLQEAEPIMLSPVQKTLVYDNHRFGFNLLREVSLEEGNAGRNMVISPLCASAAMNLMANAADEEWAARIREILGHEEKPEQEVNDYYSKMLHELPAVDRSTRVSMAYSMWFKTGFNVKKEFKEMGEKNFATEIFVTDLVKAQAQINKWCSDKTFGEIKNIDIQLHKELKAILFNALYFKGIWKEPFDKKKTHEGKFYGSQRTSDVKFMFKGLPMYLTGTDHFIVVPYAYGNSAYKMLFILPDEGVEISEAIDYLAEGEWSDVLYGKKTECHVYLHVPRYEITFESKLHDQMRRMGVEWEKIKYPRLSDEFVDFDVMSQKTTIKVDEEGTKAATVTHVSGGYNENEIKDVEEIYFNRPFLFAITEKSTGAILFLGKVENL